jgi:lipopolysaccharide/colanic/teichoic acid biosynthesis glycosyltransferase
MDRPRSDGARDQDRITPLGRLLRTTSIDELPSLWNIVRGEMAFVGPRPLLEVRPGLTGWAQVNGRNRLTWDEKFALDVWYVDHRNRRLDARIILRTAKTILRPSDISHAGYTTMPRFSEAGPDAVEPPLGRTLSSIEDDGTR